MYKIDLHKGESTLFSYQDFFDLILGWNEWMDNKPIMEEVDLCLFYKCKEKSTGGVFTREYTSRNSEGSLSKFPFIFYMGEERPKPEYNCEEIVRVANIHEMDEVYIVAIDYNAAFNDDNLNGFALPIVLQTYDTTPLLTIKYSKDVTEYGNVCVLATLKEVKNEILFENKSKLMSLSEAFSTIPGFDSLGKHN